MCGLLRSQYSHCEEPISSPTGLRDARQIARSPDLHKSGPQECLSPYPNQGWGRVQNAFRTQYGQFEYRIMPFGFMNAPGTFQAYIDDCLRPYIDHIAVCYFDDILIYLTNEEEHDKQVCQVLERLREFGLYRNAEKCLFGGSEVGFLGFVISPDGIAMESDRISTIEDWPTLESVRDLQVLLGFTNFYWRFIRKYAKVTTPISDLLKKAENSRTSKQVKSEWTGDAELMFRKSKCVITDAPILKHFEPAEPIILQTDASGFAIAGILNQYYGLRTLRPVNFYSQKSSGAEKNYDIYDQKLLAITETMKQWRHYLEGANHEVLIQCDHKNLEYFQTSKVLSQQQAIWAEILSSYDFVLEHQEGKKNPADGPSRRPDYEIGSENMTARLLATLAVTTITESYGDLLPEIKTAQEADFLATEIRPTLVDVSTADESQWRSIDGALTNERRIYLPVALRSRVTSLFHDNPESGHFGALKTAELVSRDIHWPGMDSEIRKYVAGCELCHRIKALRHAQYGLNMTLPPPSLPWEGITTDIITDSPESIASGYTKILVIIDRLTEVATSLPCRNNIDSPELAPMFFEHVICKHGVPDIITTDRDKEFTSRFWDRGCYHLSINHRLSTAFHPQTEGQTERLKQPMEQYLQAFCNYKQDNWVELLPLAEFAFNNSIHHSALMTPFWANYNYHPTMQFKPPKDPSYRSQVQADSSMTGMKEADQMLRENIIEAQEWQTKYAGGK